MTETPVIELTGPIWSNERGDLEVTCSTLKTAKEPLEVVRLSRRFFCRGSHFCAGSREYDQGETNRTILRDNEAEDFPYII
jgi:hypothetical protein